MIITMQISTLYMCRMCFISIFYLFAIESVMARSQIMLPDSLQVLRFDVNGVPFSMQRVEGGVHKKRLQKQSFFMYVC